METYMETLGCRAKEASRAAAKLTTVEKNRGLEFVAEELCLRKEELLSENEKDMEAAREQGMSEALQDRLRLTQARIEAMAEGLRQIAGLSDPIGEVLSMKNRHCTVLHHSRDQPGTASWNQNINILMQAHHLRGNCSARILYK